MKQWIVAALLTVMLVGGGMPHAAVAATNEREVAYRATLLALIDALTQQIAALTAELAERTVLTPTRAVTHDDAPYRTLRTYNIDPDTTTVSLRNRTDEVFVNRVLALTPARYRPYLSDVVVFDGDRDDSDAYVRGKKYSDGRFTWYFAVSDEFLQDDVTAAIRNELIVHELGHIVSLANALDPGSRRVCHEALADRESCPNPDSVYGQFVTEFWPTQLLDALAQHNDGFETITLSAYQSWFVSRYASLHPAEDFAETFMVYVLGTGAEYDTAKTREKFDFMDQFATVRAVRQEILSNL